LLLLRQTAPVALGYFVGDNRTDVFHRAAG
jgi:hypothetical protein